MGFIILTIKASGHVVARTLLAAIHGAVRTIYEGGMPPAIGGEVERQLTLMCRSYLIGAREGVRRAA